MVAIVVTTGVAGIAFAHFGGELIPVRDGLGYDGARYAALVKHPHLVFDGDVSHHRIQRVAPSLLVRVILELFDLAQSDTAIILAFQFLNITVAAGACLLWAGVARRWALDKVATWFAFIALFVNYAMAKFPTYYPILTDTSGFALGVALLWAFVAKKPAIMLGVALLAAFTWPVVLYAALILFIYSHSDRMVALSRPQWWRPIVISLATVATSIYIATERTDMINNVVLNHVVFWLVAPSSVLLGSYIYLGMRPLLDRITVRELVRSINWLALAITVLMLLAVASVHRAYSVATEQTLQLTLANILVEAIQKPAIFFVSAFGYFGPAILVVAAVWWKAVRYIADEGIGMIVVMSGFVLLSITSESRLLMSVWPFFVAYTARAIDAASVARSQIIAFVVLSVLSSRLWLPLQLGHVDDSPGWLYRASIGWRMPLSTYLLMTVAWLVVGVGMWVFCIAPLRRSLSEEGAAA